MSVALVINGVTYPYPETDDTDWGANATSWAQAVTVGMLQKSGGLFQLLAEVDFGTAFGVKSLYLKSRTANPADAGQIRLARADVINWRNNANDGNLSLGVSASDVLQFNGTNIQGAISVSDTATIDLDLTANVLSANIKNDSITNAMINSAAAIAYSKLNLSGSIVNADINAAAAIAYSKLNLSGSIVNADINAAAAIAYSKLSLTGNIVNADINASAAIAFSKLAALTSTNILVGSAGNVATSVAMSGDVTIGNTGVTAIGANKVVNSMLAQMAQSTFKGRAAAAGTGDPVDLTATQATAILNNFVGDSGSGGTKGLVLAPAAGDAAANKFLNADGTWKATPAGGDVTGPGAATDNGFVRFDGTTGKLLKNSAATITNADVIAAAAIAVNKLAALTVSRAVVTDASGFITQATTTAAEIGFVNGVSSSIQTQINTKLPTTITTTGDLIYSSSGTTASALAIGGTGQQLKVVSGLPAWAYPTYRSVTTTDSPTLADDVLNCSGASFTMTLPTAIGCQGKKFTIIHNGTSLTQLYTLATTSAQTIGGIASGSFILSTTGEVLEIQSNNANWIIIDRVTISTPASWTPQFATKFTVTAANATAGATYTNNGQTFTVAATIAGVTTLQTVGTGNPSASGTLSKASGTGDNTITYSAFANSLGTVSGVTFWWQRRGNIMRIWGSLLPGTATSNLFMMSIPASANLDTNYINPNNTISNPGMLIGNLQFTGAASAVYNIVTATGTGVGTTLLYNANINSGTTQLTPQTSNGGIVSGALGSMWAEFPISGWQP